MRGPWRQGITVTTWLGRRLVLVAVLLATIGCDRVTKHAAVLTLAGAPDRSFFGDAIRLTYAENTGGFLGVGESLPSTAKTAIFTVGTGMLLVALAVYVLRTPWPVGVLIGLGLFLGGGLSNWADRVVRGSVVDFLNVGMGPLRTGIFNVADVALLAGAAIVGVADVRRRRRQDETVTTPPGSE